MWKGTCAGYKGAPGTHARQPRAAAEGTAPQEGDCGNSHAALPV
jgi:hypothetical protein